MKIASLFLVLMLSVFSSYAQVRVNIGEEAKSIKTVAVIGQPSTLCTGQEDDGQSLAGVLEGELLRVYSIVERRHLDQILREQRLALGGLIMEEQDYAKAGCLAGAEGTVICSYGCLSGRSKIQVKMVDCSTSNLFWSATGIEATEFELCDELVTALTTDDESGEDLQRKKSLELLEENETNLEANTEKEKKEKRSLKDQFKSRTGFGIYAGGTITRFYGDWLFMSSKTVGPYLMFGGQWEMGFWRLRTGIWQRGGANDVGFTDEVGAPINGNIVERHTHLFVGASRIVWGSSKGTFFTLGATIGQFLASAAKWKIDGETPVLDEPLDDRWDCSHIFQKDWRQNLFNGNSPLNPINATVNAGATAQLKKGQLALDFSLELFPHAEVSSQDWEKRTGTIGLSYTHMLSRKQNLTE